jgi:hypothetical protein
VCPGSTPQSLRCPKPSWEECFCTGDFPSNELPQRRFLRMLLSVKGRFLLGHHSAGVGVSNCTGKGSSQCERTEAHKRPQKELRMTLSCVKEVREPLCELNSDGNITPPLPAKYHHRAPRRRIQSATGSAPRGQDARRSLCAYRAPAQWSQSSRRDSTVLRSGPTCSGEWKQHFRSDSRRTRAPSW